VKKQFWIISGGGIAERWMNIAGGIVLLKQRQGWNEGRDRENVEGKSEEGCREWSGIT